MSHTFYESILYVGKMCLYKAVRWILSSCNPMKTSFCFANSLMFNLLCDDILIVESEGERSKTGFKFWSSPILDGCNGIRLSLFLFSSLSYPSKPRISLFVKGHLSYCKIIFYFLWFKTDVHTLLEKGGGSMGCGKQSAIEDPFWSLGLEVVQKVPVGVLQAPWMQVSYPDIQLYITVHCTGCNPDVP